MTGGCDWNLIITVGSSRMSSEFVTNKQKWIGSTQLPKVRRGKFRTKATAAYLPEFNVPMARHFVAALAAGKTGQLAEGSSRLRGARPQPSSWRLNRSSSHLQLDLGAFALPRPPHACSRLDIFATLFPPED